MIRFIYVGLIFTIFLFVDASIAQTFENSNCITLSDNPSAILFWVLNDTVGQVHYKLEVGAVNGWFALSIGESQSATTKDIVVGWIDDASCTSGCVNDAYITGGSPQFDTDIGGADDITNGNFAVMGGKTVMTWSKLLVTPNGIGDIAIDPSNTIYLHLAYEPEINDPEDAFLNSDFSSFESSSSVEVVLERYKSNCTGYVIPTMENSYTNPDGTWTLVWSSPKDATNIYFSIRAKTSGWTSLGLSYNDMMPNSDIYWGQINNDGYPVVDDRWATGHTRPPKDSIQNVNILYVSGSYVDGTTTLTFSRKLDTHDDKDIPITDQTIYVLWAIGSSKGTYLPITNDYLFSQHDTQGIARVNFFTGSATTVKAKDELRKAHGIIMILAWGVLSLLGTFIARYMKTSLGQWWLFGYTWLHIHASLHVFTLVFTVIASILIFVYTTDKEIEHFKSVHEILGLIILIFAFIQPLLGISTERLMRRDKNQHWAQKALGIIHTWFGRLTLLLAVINIYLGFYLLCVNMFAVVSFSIILFIFVLLFVSHEIMRFVPYGGFFGGLGFSYANLKKKGKDDADEEDDKDGDKDDDEDSIEMDDMKDKNILQKYTKGQLQKKPPLFFKVIVWTVQGTAFALIAILWVLVVIGISISDLDSVEDDFDPRCRLGRLP